MLVILTGAVKNIGDFLIADRAKKLLTEYVDSDIVEINRFNNLEPYLDVINNSRALILCGGPAYAPGMYPDIYPLVSDLSKIKVPIIPFGIGWFGKPFHHYEDFRFSDKTKHFLKETHEKIEFSSCRDILTKDILENEGVNNVLMTGCPVWYDLESINKPFRFESDVKKVVITSGARADLLIQSIRILFMVKRKFQSAKIYLSYHRGIFPGKGTPPRKGISYTLLALVGWLAGASIVDVSSDLNRIKFYDDCDLHIGYRVHAHLYFLSKRLPSILINEDGRGLGMVKSMNLPVLNFDDKEMLLKLSQLLDDYVDTQFKAFLKVQQYIDQQFIKMKDFLSYLSKL